MQHIVYLSLGSNLGDRVNNINKAIDAIRSHLNIEVEKVSSFYETEPIGYTEEQPWFYNIAVKLRTSLLPEALHAFTKSVEADLGRERIKRWGPRTIDIDILLFDGIERTKEELTIPHPRMLDRAFVLVPLKQIEPSLILPNNMTVSEFTENFEQLEKIYLVKNN